MTNLRARVERHEISERRLAINAGFSQPHVHNVLKGARSLTPEVADRLMETVGILQRRHHTPKELSGGEQQRTAIARALINDPQVVFADEPIGNLDSRSGKEVLELLRKINQEKGITILMVTHSEESTRYGKRVIRLKDGEVMGTN